MWLESDLQANVDDISNGLGDDIDSPVISPGFYCMIIPMFQVKFDSSNWYNIQHMEIVNDDDQ
ncbi:MAG: hypothetical protein IPN29_09435 [Saprospiraceae bacterium]|nr:hypothetical protein [Saprospiraceae bacterium]